MDWFGQMKKALNDKSPFMEISTLSLGWLSSTRTLRRSSTAGQSRLNSSSRLLRRLRTAKKEDAVIIKAQEEKVKTILNPEKTQYMKSLKSKE